VQPLTVLSIAVGLRWWGRDSADCAPFALRGSRHDGPHGRHRTEHRRRDVGERRSGVRRARCQCRETSTCARSRMLAQRRPSRGGRTSQRRSAPHLVVDPCWSLRRPSPWTSGASTRTVTPVALRRGRHAHLREAAMLCGVDVEDVRTTTTCSPSPSTPGLGPVGARQGDTSPRFAHEPRTDVLVGRGEVFVLTLSASRRRTTTARVVHCRRRSAPDWRSVEACPTPRVTRSPSCSPR